MRDLCSVAAIAALAWLLASVAQVHAEPSTTAESSSLPIVSINVHRITLENGTDSAAKLLVPWKNDLHSMRPDGSWADVDYTDKTSTKWPTFAHLSRLERIARGLYQSGAPSSEARQQIVQSLTFWLDHDPKHSNWWFNEIAVPREVGIILLILGDDAPSALRDRGIELMKRADWTRETGANLLDETWIGVMRGVLEQSTDTLATQFGRSWQETRSFPPTQDGIQSDGSFHQHGPLLYSQSYGTVFLDSAQRIMQAGHGSTFVPPPPALNAMDHFLLDGDLWMSRHWVWDFGTCGRAICRPDATHHSLQTDLDAFAQQPGDQYADISAIAQQTRASDDADLPTGNRHFWNSDYMVQRRPDYFASVRMYSKRTANTDTLTTGENKKSHHIADGSTCLMLSGQEYFNIYPVWDWLRIPGTTIEQDTPFLPKTIKRLGNTSFVGGVSDGSIGCAAMDFQYNKLHARKSWFFFDHEIVCLGTGIECATDHAVLTTLNQCLLHGDVHSSQRGDIVPVGDHHLSGPQWLWHDGIGYVIPDAEKLDITIGPQHGAWSDIGTGSSEIGTRDVFNLAIDHGNHVTGGNYEYVLMPGIEWKQMADLAGHLPIKIISNSPQQQAVTQTQQQITSAVFYEPGELRIGSSTIQVDQPCLLLFHLEAASVEISVSNPNNEGGTVQVHTSLPLQGEGVTSEGSGSVIQIEFPTGDEAGKSVVRHFTLRK